MGMHSPLYRRHGAEVKTQMTKTQEIALIREFAEKLGPNSYFGPVLKDQLADIEQTIRNDLYPETMAGTREYITKLRREAEDQAAFIRSQAWEDAEHIRATALNGALIAKEMARARLKEALEALS
jgi:hypothetical protein